jgi:isopentenyl diphosphate isomerase/L-lactate dehydrogenase-like FMN-dependent dehydrogenase
MILSTASSKPLEEVAAEARPTPHWYQLYWPNDLDMALSFVHRAEAAGYSAIVFTLDTFLLAWRERDLQNAYLPFLMGEGLGNYFSDPVFQSRLTVSPKVNPIAAIQHFSRVFSNPRLTWDDVAFLRKNTKLPVIVKGVLCTDDARRAVDHGANGIIVSNHGGRQVEGAIAALDALPGIVDAVGAQTTVLFDSGIRRGSDILKAMALGAKAVLLGRPYCYGLALNGADGVAEVIANLRADLDLSLGLIGCASLAELSREHLARSS